MLYLVGLGELVVSLGYWLTEFAEEACVCLDSLKFPLNFFDCLIELNNAALYWYLV